MGEHLAGRSREFQEGGSKIVRIGDVEIGVFRRTGSLYAYENRCVHQGGPACEGAIMAKVEAVLGTDRVYLGERFSEEEAHLVCPWHGWEYDLATGECVADRRLRLKRYSVIERGDEVYVVI
jgi:nitrite reductase/ring-hydroxylating ferredoxin subunit